MSNYIEKICKHCQEIGDKYGYMLIDLMDRYGATNLQQISELQANEFYNDVVKPNEK